MGQEAHDLGEGWPFPFVHAFLQGTPVASHLMPCATNFPTRVQCDAPSISKLQSDAFDIGVRSQNRQNHFCRFLSLHRAVARNRQDIYSIASFMDLSSRL